MYSEYRAYMDMFKKKHIINEADDDKGLTLDDIDKIAEDAKEDVPKQKETSTKETDTNQETENKISEEKPAQEHKPQTAEMKFSVDLATEFSNTINQFTNVCAQIVKTRVIDKETSDKFYDLYGKIKNLADAASKTE